MKVGLGTGEGLGKWATVLHNCSCFGDPCLKGRETFLVIPRVIVTRTSFHAWSYLFSYVGIYRGNIMRKIKTVINIRIHKQWYIKELIKTHPVISEKSIRSRKERDVAPW